MKFIPLTNSPFHAIVDDLDYDKVKDFTWYAWSIHNCTYARSNKGEMMHVVVYDRDGVQRDHADRNGLNNSRDNLRTCTESENRINSPKRKDNWSGYKGVYWAGWASLWCAELHKNGKRVHRSYHKTIEAAAHAYDKAALQHFGAYAFTNFPVVIA